MARFIGAQNLFSTMVDWRQGLPQNTMGLMWEVYGVGAEAASKSEQNGERGEHFLFKRRYSASA